MKASNFNFTVRGTLRNGDLNGGQNNSTSTEREPDLLHEQGNVTQRTHTSSPDLSGVQRIFQEMLSPRPKLPDPQQPASPPGASRDLFSKVLDL